MFPIILDLTNLRIALVGGGNSALKRLKALDAAGARHLSVFADNFGKEFWEIAGTRLITRMPNEEDIRSFYAVMIVDVEDEKAASIADLARANGILVNIEDRKEYCDFYYPSIVRDGDLLIAVSTSGKSPTMAMKIKEYIASIFGSGWSERLDEIANMRDKWRAEGHKMSEVAKLSNEYIDEKGWFSENITEKTTEEA